MKKLLLLVGVLVFVSCQKETIVKTQKEVTMKRNGYKYQYIHNGIPQDTNVFMANVGDSIRLKSQMSVPMSHYAFIIVNNDTVFSHNGLQDSVNFSYIIN